MLFILDQLLLQDHPMTSLSYKNLGIFLDEHLDFGKTVAHSAGRALGLLMAKSKCLGVCVGWGGVFMKLYYIMI